MTIEAFLACLEGVRPRGSGRWSARCPAHADKSPSLSIGVHGTRILIHCFGACEPPVIVKAIGLTMSDLFTDHPTASNQRSTPSRQRMDRDEIAFQFELAALDRRCRAEQVLSVIAAFSGVGMADDERDRLLTAVAYAYADQDRAELLEIVADDLTLKAYQERMAHHAA